MSKFLSVPTSPATSSYRLHAACSTYCFARFSVCLLKFRQQQQSMFRLDVLASIRLVWIPPASMPRDDSKETGLWKPSAPRLSNPANIHRVVFSRPFLRLYRDPLWDHLNKQQGNGSGLVFRIGLVESSLKELSALSCPGGTCSKSSKYSCKGPGLGEGAPLELWKFVLMLACRTPMHAHPCSNQQTNKPCGFCPQELRRLALPRRGVVNPISAQDEVRT